MGQVRFLSNDFSLENVFIVFSKLCAVVCGSHGSGASTAPINSSWSCALGLCSSTKNQALAASAKSYGLLLIKETLPWYEVLECLVRNQLSSIFNKNVWFSDVFKVLLYNQVWRRTKNYVSFE